LEFLDSFLQQSNLLLADWHIADTATDFRTAQFAWIRMRSHDGTPNVKW
jgi:hypothetical protein